MADRWVKAVTIEEADTPNDNDHLEWDNATSTWQSAALSVDTANIVANAVTNAELAEMEANTVKANATAGSANPANLAVGLFTVVGRVAGNIVAAELVTAQVADDAISYAKMQNVISNDVVLGRISGAGGAVEELAGDQATAILDTFSTSSTTQGVVAGSNSVGATYYLNGNGTWSIPPGGSAATLTKSVTAEDPTASENISMFYTNVAITVTQITSVIQGTTSVTFDIEHGTSRATATGTGVIGTDVVCNSSTTGVVTTTFTDDTIPADSFVWLSTSAISGTPDEFHVTVEYTED